MHDGSKTRLKLLDAAQAVLQEIGWDATSVALIRKRVGVSNGSLFHAFPSGKIEMATELFLRFHGELWDQPLCLLRDTGQGARSAHKASRLLVERVQASQANAGLYFILYDALLRHAMGDAIRERLCADERCVALWLREVEPERCPPSPFCLPLIFGGIIAAARAWAELPDAHPLVEALELFWMPIRPFVSHARGQKKEKVQPAQGELLAI